MSALYHIISTLIRWALVLGVTGGLAKATLYFGQQAAETTQNGLVSLGALNRQLIGKPHGKITHTQRQQREQAHTGQ